MKIKKALKILREKARDLYELNTLAYHNWPHAKRTRKWAKAFYKGPNKRSVKLAADWHDAYYVINQVVGFNEQASADLLNGAYGKIRHKLKPKSQTLMDDIVRDASELVCSTCLTMHLHPERVVLDELAALLDADLAAFAFDFDKFVTAQESILIENNLNPYDITNLNKSAAFLEKFLTVRDHIFHTDAARSMWEDKARANISNFMERANVEYNRTLALHSHHGADSDATSSPV